MLDSFHAAKLNELRPDLLHMQNVNIGTYKKCVNKRGRAYWRKSTTDADSLMFDSAGKLCMHGEITHLGKKSYRQSKDIISKFLAVRQKYPYKHCEYFMQFGGIITAELIKALSQERIQLIYVPHTTDCITLANSLYYHNFMRNMFTGESGLSGLSGVGGASSAKLARRERVVREKSGASGERSAADVLFINSDVYAFFLSSTYECEDVRNTFFTSIRCG